MVKEIAPICSKGGALVGENRVVEVAEIEASSHTSAYLHAKVGIFLSVNIDWQQQEGEGQQCEACAFHVFMFVGVGLLGKYGGVVVVRQLVEPSSKHFSARGNGNPNVVVAVDTRAERCCLGRQDGGVVGV